MKRSARGRNVGPWSWIGALVLTGGLLVGVFTLVDPARTVGEWPLGIGSREVDAYAALLDLRQQDSLLANPERYLLSGKANACAMETHRAEWYTQWFDAEGYGDSVRVRSWNGMPSSWLIEFPEQDPFRAQRRIVLVPASVTSMRFKYLELLANEMGLIAPEVSFVRLVACGLDQGIYLKQEVVDVGFLAKRGMVDAALVTQGHDADRPDHTWPRTEGDTAMAALLLRSLQLAYDDLARGDASSVPYLMDQRALACMLLLAWMDRGDDAFASSTTFAYDGANGRLLPVFLPVGGTVSQGRPAKDLFTMATLDAGVRKEVERQWLRYVDDRWRLKERFAAMDRAWLPILAEGSSLSHAGAEAQRIQSDLLREPAGASPLEALSPPLAGRSATRYGTGGSATRYWPSVDDERTMRSIADRTKARFSNDTLFFPRGKYAIKDDLILPLGYVLVMEQGARLEIAPGKSVVVQGPLWVKGTPKNPVFVRAAEERAPFGTFAVLGNGSTACSISGLQLSGGSGASVNGARFGGQFAVHDALVILRQCAIEANGGAGGTSFKNVRLEAMDCAFTGAGADLVSLDRAKGGFERCSFKGEVGGAQQNGILMRNSRLSVVNCTISGSSGAGVHVHRASQVLVRRSRFVANGTAVSAADLGIAYLEGNSFVDNGSVVQARRLDPTLGGARVMRYANEYNGNRREQEVDEHSAVVNEAAMGEEVLRLFEAD